MSLAKGFEVYSTYVALKRHFTSDYDFIKYKGALRLTVSSYEKRNDKYFFVKISERKDWFEYLLANMIVDPNLWIGKLVQDDQCQKNYIQFKKVIQSLTYIFKGDLSKLDDDFDSNLLVHNGQYPKLLTLYMQHEIRLETLVILDDLTGCSKLWEREISDSVVWPSINKKCQDYKPFLQLCYSKEKMKKVVLDTFV